MFTHTKHQTLNFVFLFLCFTPSLVLPCKTEGATTPTQSAPVYQNPAYQNRVVEPLPLPDNPGLGKELISSWFLLAIFVVGTIAVVVIFVSILRWALRLNEIAGYLKRIADHLSPIPPKPPKLRTIRGRCDCCRLWFFIETLTTTKDKKLFCPTCVKLL